MKNYRLIKEYLETMPGNSTVSQLLDNINNAEITLKSSVEEMKARLSENIGKCYTYTDVDDCDDVAKFFVKIIGVKTVYDHQVAYNCNVIEITEDSIFYEENATIYEKELIRERLIDESFYNSLFNKFQALLDVKVNG
jgi:hypothetical protein